MADLLVAAAVAAVVTLLSEYAAKPSLEARRDRILEGHRDTRQVKGHFASASAWLGHFSVTFSSELNAQGRPDLYDEAEAMLSIIRRGSLRCGSVIEAAYMHFAICLLDWLDNDVRADDQLDKVTFALEEYVSLPVWNVPARRRGLRRIRSVPGLIT